MSDTAEMGPLDIQIQKPGELGELISGLTSAQAIDILRAEVFHAFEEYLLKLRYRSGLQIGTKMAAEIAARMAVGAFRPVSAQLDPMRLADNMRANMIAYEYGQRIKTENVKDETIETLISSYPFHGFVIDREEASRLFENVRGPSESEAKLGDAFRSRAEEALKEDEPIIVLMPEPLAGKGDNDELLLIEKLEKYRKRQARIIDRLSRRPVGGIRATRRSTQTGTRPSAADTTGPRGAAADPQ